MRERGLGNSNVGVEIDGVNAGGGGVEGAKRGESLVQFRKAKLSVVNLEKNGLLLETELARVKFEEDVAALHKCGLGDGDARDQTGQFSCHFHDFGRRTGNPSRADG